MRAASRQPTRSRCKGGLETLVRFPAAQLLYSWFARTGFGILKSIADIDGASAQISDLYKFALGFFLAVYLWYAETYESAYYFHFAQQVNPSVLLSSL